MKKMKFWSVLLLMVVFLPVLNSCSSDDENSPSLTGTKWTSTINDKKYILEFSSGSEVLLYEADINNNYVDNLDKGNYSFDKNTVNFNESISLSYSPTLSFRITFNYFKTANIGSNTMTVITREKELKVNISTSDSEEIEKGEKKFTFMKVM